MTTNKKGHEGEPCHDIYCRGCHERPSYKNISTYLCGTCWNRWNEVRRSAELLQDSDVDSFKDELVEFIKKRGEYVWHPEVYLHLRAVSGAELKRHNIKVAVICRDLGLFAPADDRITREASERVREFALDYLALHDRMPKVREVIKGARVDHTTLWSCMDYEEFVARHGGKIDTNLRHRFDTAHEFLQAAAQVVWEADCPLHMTVILEELEVSYPAYLSNFKAVNSEAIHELAGISRAHCGVSSMLEAAGEKALTNLGWEVERQASFPGLVGIGGRLLKFDFRLVGTSILVEIDGPQHYVMSDTYHKKSGLVHDRLKDDYAKREGYQLVRVDARIHKSPKSMMGFLRPRVGMNPLNPSNALNTSGPARRRIKRGETRDRPNPE